MKKIKYSEITPEKIYRNRRSFIKSMGLGAVFRTIDFIQLFNIRSRLSWFKYENIY